MSTHKDKAAARKAGTRKAMGELREWLFCLAHPVVALEVGKGAELLDEKSQFWAHKVNCETLVISRGDSCMLAQLHGSFMDGIKKYGMEIGTGFGFNCGPQHDHLYRRAWEIEVHKRLDQAYA